MRKSQLLFYFSVRIHIYIYASIYTINLFEILYDFFESEKVPAVSWNTGLHIQKDNIWIQISHLDISEWNWGENYSAKGAFILWFPNADFDFVWLTSRVFHLDKPC